MSSLTALSHLHQVNSQLEDIRQKLNEPIVPITNEVMLQLSTQLQPLYKKLLITNLDDGLSRQLENGLWNDCFKTPLTRFGRTDKNLFHLMIEAGVGFYLGLIQDIGIHFDISFITNTSANNKLYCTKTSQSPLVSPSKASVYYIIQNCLLHVGDLLRYRGSLPEALKMYEKSAAVCPSNGLAYHQMGIAQLLISGNDDHLAMNNCVSSYYYFARALSVSNPHLQAYNAFDTITNKILNLSTNNSKCQDFIKQFLVMISTTLGKDQCPAPGSYNMVPALSPLVTNQQIKPSIIFQMIIIALWAQCRQTNCDGSSSADEFLLEIIAGILNSILISAIGLFRSEDSDSGSPGGNNIDKRFFCIPHLRLLMDWLVQLQQNEKSAHQLSFICDKAHVGTLVQFLNQIKAYNQQNDEDLTINVILPEEKRLIGFLPLDYSYMRLGGGSLIDENNPKTQKTRINRLILGAIKLSKPNSSGKNFIGYDGNSFTEPNSSPISLMPSRRNVALQSIFRSSSQSGFDNASPTTIQMSLSLSGANSGDIFRSIWTPDEDTKFAPTPADSTWN